MKKRVIPVVFIVIAAVLAVVLINRKFLYKPKIESTAARVVTPQVSSTGKKTNTDTTLMTDGTAMTSLIPLHNDETLISIVSMDFNGDGLEDQVNAVRTAASPYISLVVGLYDAKKNVYERMAVIATKITQVKTFAYTGMDLTGEHRISLVYQGYAENGDSVLHAFFLANKAGKFNLQQIANFEADGTIFIQQLDRYDAYERSQSTGISFPIWVYSTDTSADPNGNDQLQTRYDWNPEEQQYVKAVQVRVAGSKMAAKELARIQDGTVKTFAGFLDGLWYKTDNDNSGMRYVFFDYDANEIIFLLDDVEEVYNWVNGTLRRNGIYISATNQEIQNLQRRVDISLISTDTITIKIQDDVRMLIGENTFWDGEYKKKSIESFAASLPKQVDYAAPFIESLEKGPRWKTADGSSILFKQGSYTVTGDAVNDEGDYTSENADEKPFIQFRSKTGTEWFTGSYLVSYAEKPQQKDDASKAKITQLNNDSIILQPYMVTPEGCYPAEKPTIVLTRDGLK